MEEKLLNLIKAQNRVIMVVSHEIQRVEGFVNSCVKELQVYKHNKIQKWYIWNSILGLRKITGKTVGDYKGSPERLFNAIIEQDQELTNAIVIIENAHFYLKEDDYLNIQRFKSLCNNSSINTCVILQQPCISIPVEIEKDIVIFEVEYPTIDDLEVIYENVCEQFNLTPNVEECKELLNSLLGLTIMEASSALKQAYVEKGYLNNSCDSVILQTKEQIIKKSGYLEYYHPKEELASVGGLENLKEWLEKRGSAYTQAAKEFGLEAPKGILLLGVPGTGKSLTAKAISAQWHFPLLKLDMGKIFAGIVGQSEANIRNALNIAEALAPSILWIDEIEKGLSGAGSSDQTDGGVTSRILGTFLTWMQEKSKPVFVIATANDVSKLPPELLRKGRIDEIFFVDLPSEKARKEIFEIHIKKIKREVKNFDLKRLAEDSVGYTGAEIEEAIKEALFSAFNIREEITTEYISKALKGTYPLSKTMAKTINDLRIWAKSRTVLASEEEVVLLKEEVDGNIPILKQEKSNNPFIK